MSPKSLTFRLLAEGLISPVSECLDREQKVMLVSLILRMQLPGGILHCPHCLQ
jgi:hypothetical protein